MHLITILESQNTKTSELGTSYTAFRELSYLRNIYLFLQMIWQFFLPCSPFFRSPVITRSQTSTNQLESIYFLNAVAVIEIRDELLRDLGLASWEEKGIIASVILTLAGSLRLVIWRDTLKLNFGRQKRLMILFLNQSDKIPWSLHFKI